MGEILAKGDLRSRPLAHLLVHALDRKLVGELFLAVPGGRTFVVQLLRGAPVKARRSQPDSRPSSMLSGIAAQLIATNGPAARAEWRWM